jgi:hypothetical protein
VMDGTCLSFHGPPMMPRPDRSNHA